mgnify:CR=1 FL=1
MLKLFYLTLLEYISCILIMDAAVSSTDFLVTSITGHLYFWKAFFASQSAIAAAMLLGLPAAWSYGSNDASATGQLGFRVFSLARVMRARVRPCHGSSTVEAPNIVGSDCWKKKFVAAVALSANRSSNIVTECGWRNQYRHTNTGDTVQNGVKKMQQCAFGT